MEEVECPYCEYTGAVRSVEAHISGSCEGDHAGEVGRSYREELRMQIEESPEIVDEERASVPDGGTGPTKGQVLVIVTALFLVSVVVMSFTGDVEEDEPEPEEEDETESDAETLTLMEG